MEVHFPHLTNGIVKVMPTRRQRAKTLRKMAISTIVALLTVVGIVSVSSASTSEKKEDFWTDVLAKETAKDRTKMCYLLADRINLLMFKFFKDEVKEAWELTSDEQSTLLSLTTSYANYCKN